MTEALSVLNKYFNYDSFRPGQEEIINSILSGSDTLAVMPTGGGKSLCYQIPALLKDGLTVVISPLIALMKDQVDILIKKGIPADFISSSKSDEELNETYHKIISKKLKLLYISPERLFNKGFIEFLKSIKPAFLAVDEAHCISEWGHDFRPAYREISKVIELFPGISRAAFTATATSEVRDDIILNLKLRSPKSFIKGFDRPNLSYRTEVVKDKKKRLLELLNGLDGSAVIYCPSRKKTEEYYNFLNGELSNVAYYHAGLHSNFRKQEQENFISGKKNIIVATNAFGMGIDKANVRLVVHTGMTQTIESYYQEAGRAGRDGNESQCVILYSNGDRDIQDFFLNLSFPTFEDLQKVHDVLYNFNKVPKGAYDESSVILTSKDIAEKTRLSKTIVDNTLALFERHKVLSIGRSSKNAKLRISSGQERIREYYENIDQNRRDILEALLRSISSDAFSSFVEIDLDKMIIKHGLDRDKLEQALKSFAFSGIIEYQLDNSVPGINLLFPRTELNMLPIDLEEFYKRKDALRSKINDVQRYIQTSECKRNYILNYFGESRSDKCGKCSSCIGVSSTETNTEQIKFISNAFISSLKEINNKISKNQLVDYLLGKNSEKLSKMIPAKSEYYGSCSSISKNTLVDALESLLEKGEIHSEGSLIKYLKLPKNNSGNQIDNDIYSLINSGTDLKELLKSFRTNERDLLKKLEPSKVVDLNFILSEEQQREVQLFFLQEKDLNARDLQMKISFDLSINRASWIIRYLKNKG